MRRFRDFLVNLRGSNHNSCFALTVVAVERTGSDIKYLLLGTIPRLWMSESLVPVVYLG